MIERIEWHMLPPVDEPLVVVAADLGVVIVLTEALAGKRLVILPSGAVAVLAISVVPIPPMNPTDAQVDRCMALGVDLCP